MLFGAKIHHGTLLSCVTSFLTDHSSILDTGLKNAVPVCLFWGTSSINLTLEILRLIFWREMFYISFYPSLSVLYSSTIILYIYL